MMRLRPALVALALALVSAAALFGAGLGSAASRRPKPKPVQAKRGVASSHYLQADPRALSRLGASWAYDWSNQPPPRDRRLEWVPMVRGSGSVTPRVLSSLRAAARAGRARYLLGFNEPDSSSQADMTPAQAAQLWPELESTGLRLGSPAPQVPGDGWLGQFMTLATQRHLRVDFIALHYYQDFTNPGAVGALRRQLTHIHNAYGKPIWITEIGAIDLRSWGEPMMLTPTGAMADTYMRHLFAMLDSLPFVQRYAWFTDDCWNHPDCRYGSLFTGGGQLTPAAHAFEAAR